MAAPTVDGKSQANTTSGGASSLGVAITTSGTNRIVVACVNISYGTPSGEGMSGGGLTWNLRKKLDNSGTSGQYLYEYWALASSTLAAEVMTFTAGATCQIQLCLFGVAGANTTTPYDSNSGLPKDATGFDAAPTTTINTSCDADLIIGCLGYVTESDTSNTASAGTGYTINETPTNPRTPINAFFLGGGAATETKGVTSKQTSLVVDFVLVTSQNWGLIADAVKSSSASCSSVFTKTLTETVTDGNILVRKSKKVLTQTVTSGNVLIKKAKKVLTQTVTDTDTIKKAPVKRFAETVTSGNVLVKNTVRRVVETVTDTDTLNKLTVRHLAAESFSALDTMVKRPIKVLAETNSTLDGLVRAIKKFLSESQVLDDAWTATHTEPTKDRETIYNFLLMGRRKVKQKILSTVVVVAASPTKKAVKRLTESTPALDALTRKTIKRLTESIVGADILTTFKGIIKILTETVALSNVLIKKGIKQLIQSVTSSDVLNKKPVRRLTEAIASGNIIVRKTVRKFTEGVVDLDVMTRKLTMHRTLSEQVSNLESFSKKTVRRFATEGITASDSLRRKTVKRFSEIAGLINKLNRNTRRTLGETTNMTDVVTHIGAVVTGAIKFLKLRLSTNRFEVPTAEPAPDLKIGAESMSLLVPVHTLDLGIGEDRPTVLMETAPLVLRIARRLLGR